MGFGATAGASRRCTDELIVSPVQNGFLTVLAVAGATATFIAFVDPPPPPIWSVLLGGVVGAISTFAAWRANRPFSISLSVSVVVVAALFAGAAWVDSVEKVPDDELVESPLEEVVLESSETSPPHADLCVPLADAQESERFVFGVRGPQPTIVVADGETRTVVPGNSPSVDSGLLALVDVDDTKIVRLVDLDSNVEVAKRMFEGAITHVSLNRLQERVVVVEMEAGNSRVLLWDYSDGAATVLHDPSGEVSDPSLSPDGQSLLWAEGPRQSEAIFIAEIESFVATKLVERGESPSWSSDGTVAVFAGPFESGTAIFRRIIASGETLRLSSPVEALDSNPAVSPDCTRLVFTRAESGQVQIWAIQNGVSEQTAESVAGAEYDLEYDLS